MEINIGQSIREKRVENNMTQQELADKIGVTHAAVSFWESNTNVPNVLDCWKIADVLKISIDELIGREI